MVVVVVLVVLVAVVVEGGEVVPLIELARDELEGKVAMDDDESEGVGAGIMLAFPSSINVKNVKYTPAHTVSSATAQDQTNRLMA